MKVKDNRNSQSLKPIPKIYNSAEEASDAKYYAAKEYLKKVDMAKLAELTESHLSK